MKTPVTPFPRKTVQQTRGGANLFPRQIPRKPKVNILIVPAQQHWQAKVHRADNGSVLYASEKYLDKQDAHTDARRWAQRNSHVIGRTSGV